MICKEKRKPEMFLNVKKVTIWKQPKRWKSEKVKGYFLDEGWRNKGESLYVFPSPATYFNLPYPILPTPVKVKRWKSERVFLDEGWKNKDESLYVFPSPATYFNLLYPTLPT